MKPSEEIKEVFGNLAEIGLAGFSPHSLEGLIILPVEVSENGPIYSGNSKSVVNLMAESGIDFGLPSEGDQTVYRELRGADWFGPVLFYSIGTYIQNRDVVSISLGVISNYITDIFKGSFSKPRVRLGIVVEVEKGRKYKKISYEGPVEGLSKLAELAADNFGAIGDD